MVTQTLDYPDPAALYTGLAFSPDGHTLYASGGGNNLVRSYGVGDHGLAANGSFALPTSTPKGAKVNPFPAGIAVTPDGGRLVVADQQADAVSVIDVGTSAVHTIAAGHRPYGVALSKDGHTAYVTSQGGNDVAVVDVSGAQPVAQRSIQVGTHPNKIIASADGSTLYVANGDSDEVSVIDTASDKVTRTINLAPYPDAPVGSNPDALALSMDGHTLYVANAGNNDVAVVDTGSGSVTGLIPTGWYPTSIVMHGDQMLVTNAKGLGAGPNNGPGHPDPYSTFRAADQYSGSMMVGTLSTIGTPPPGQLQTYTQQVRTNDGFADGASVRGGDQGMSIIPRHPGEQTPIKHVIFVVRENRTYDQEFGSLGKGNGDPIARPVRRRVRPQLPQPGEDVRRLRQLLRRRRGQRPGLELDGRGELEQLRGAGLAGQLLRPRRALPLGEQRPRHRTEPGPGEGLHLGPAGREPRVLPQLRLLRRHPEQRDLEGHRSRCSKLTPTATSAASTSAAPTRPGPSRQRRPRSAATRASRSGRRSSTTTWPRETCRPPRCSACPTTTTRGRRPTRRRRGPTSPTTTGHWARSSTPCRIPSTGPRPRSS